MIEYSVQNTYYHWTPIMSKLHINKHIYYRTEPCLPGRQQDEVRHMYKLSVTYLKHADYRTYDVQVTKLLHPITNNKISTTNFVGSLYM